jgi:drug/metabolite transporter (DMT)-like permease
MLIGVLGVALIVGTDFAATDTTALLQVGIVVIGYALGPAILARRLDGLPTVGVMAVSLTLVALVFAPVAASQWPTATPSANVLIAVVVLATVCTALVRAVRRAHRSGGAGPRHRHHLHQSGRGGVPRRAGAPETFTVPMAVGFALVIAGSVLATRPAGPRSWPDTGGRLIAAPEVPISTGRATR